jgi:hypothetical protein
VAENSTLTFTISASDADGDTLTYSASNLPSGASFNTTTRVFTWTPGYTQAGTYSGVRFTVSDGSLTDYEDITITVTNTNRAPDLAAIGNKTVAENSALTFTISATDGDGDALTYSATNLPSGATFNTSTRTFSWTPSYTQAGTYSGVRFTVSDGSATDYEDITITVTNTNRAPVLTAIGNKTIAENALLTFTISATDADGDALTYSASNLPSGASFNATTRTFTWTPNYGQAGTYSGVRFSVSDGSLTDYEDITITVNDVNTAPVLAAIGNKSVNENQLLQFTVNATDAESDILTYSVSGLPSAASFVGQTFTWTPSYSQAGSYNVTFNVNDGNGGTDSETITITVNNINRAPVLNTIGNKSVTEGRLLTFNVSATDADGDSLTYSASGLPSGATFVGQTFSWTPSAAQSGNYSVVFSTNDGQVTVSETITVTVADQDAIPPNLDGLSPADGEVQVPRNTSIKFHVKDNGSGVALNTLNLSVQREGDATPVNIIVNGANQLSAYTNTVIVSGSANDYIVTYTPPTARQYRFSYNQEVSVRVSAKDNGGNTMSTQTYAFTTAMLLRGWNVKISHK